MFKFFRRPTREDPLLNLLKEQQEFLIGHIQQQQSRHQADVAAMRVQQQSLQNDLITLVRKTQETHETTVRTIAEANTKAAESLSEQARAMTSWLEGFKTDQQPQVRRYDDGVEYAAEIARKRAKLSKSGFPVDGSPLAQITAVEQQMDIDELSSLLS